MKIKIVNECSQCQGYDYDRRLCHNVNMDELKILTDQLEYIFLKKIVDELKNNSLSIAQAKEKAQLFLKLQPFVTLEDLKEKIKNFTSVHSQFSDLMGLVTSFHTEQQTDKVIEKMKDFIKNDKLDEALDAAKQTE